MIKLDWFLISNVGRNENIKVVKLIESKRNTSNGESKKAVEVINIQNYCPYHPIYHILCHICLRHKTREKNNISLPYQTTVGNLRCYDCTSVSTLTLFVLFCFPNFTDQPTTIFRRAKTEGRLPLSYQTLASRTKFSSRWKRLKGLPQGAEN